MGKSKNNDKAVPVLKHHNTKRMGEKEVQLHTLLTSVLNTECGQSHVSLRTQSTIQTASWLQALCSWDAAMLIKILLMLGLELYAPRSKLVTLLTQTSQLICIVCSIIILLPISSPWLFKYSMQYDTIMKKLLIKHTFDFQHAKCNLKEYNRTIKEEKIPYSQKDLHVNNGCK